MWGGSANFHQALRLFFGSFPSSLKQTCKKSRPTSAHCSNGSYRTFYAGKFSIYEISIYSIHETLRDCLRYTWVKALHSNFFPSVQQELSPKPVAPRQWNNLYPPQFYQTNILTRFDGRGGTGLETAGLWSLVLFILFRRYWRLNYYFFSSFSFHIVSAIEWCSNSNKLVRLIENFSFHPWLSHGFLASLSQSKLDSQTVNNYPCRIS